MRTRRLKSLLIVIMISISSSIVTAQTETDKLPDSETITPDSQDHIEFIETQNKDENPMQLREWIQELGAARINNNATLTRELQKKIDGNIDIVNSEDLTIPANMPHEGTVVNSKNFSPDWYGSDISVFNGGIRNDEHRQMAIVTGDEGNLYCLINTTLSNSQSLLYKSTNKGLNWSNISNVTYNANYAQSISLTFIDSGSVKRIGALITFGTQARPTNNASVWYVSWRTDGTHMQSHRVQTSTPSFGFRNPSICNDGFYYSAGTMYIYSVYEAVNALGNVIALAVSRSTDHGVTWTISYIEVTGLRMPVVDFKHAITGVDSLYIAYSRDISSTVKHLGVLKQNVGTLDGVWTNFIISNSGRNEHVGFSIRKTNANTSYFNQMFVTYTRNDSGRYAYSINQGTTWNSNYTVGAGNENPVSYTNCILDSQTAGSNYAKVVYISNGDSVMYRAGMLGLLGTSTKINGHINTTAVSPVISSYISGTRTYGAVLYAGSGPFTAYYDGESLLTGLTSNGNETPEKFILQQNYPNPFNPVTTISFAVPSSGLTSLKVYDLLGKEVKTLLNQQISSGVYKIELNGADMTSGVYFYRLCSGNFTETKRLVLLK